MKQNSSVVYETITVLAIHILNASEIPFEKDGRILLERYQRFLLECSDIMRQENKCLDLMICNNRICSIYAGRGNETVRKAMGAAVQIENLVEKMNHKNTYDRLERIILGMGIASGTAAMIRVSKVYPDQTKGVWLGPVMEKADCLSRAAIQNGEGRILAEKKLCHILCDEMKK